MNLLWQNRKVCVLCNLKPATMRGIKSQAMVLCASNKENTKVCLLEIIFIFLLKKLVTCYGLKGMGFDSLCEPLQ